MTERFVATSKSMAPVARFLPPEALATFAKAANIALDMGLDHNTAVAAGWGIVKQDWRRPDIGKRWVRKDGPTAGDVHVNVPMGGGKKPKKKPNFGELGYPDAISMSKLGASLAKRVIKFAPTGESTLYVNRPLKNSDELRAWARAQGFKSTLGDGEMHATLAYSKTPFDTSDLKPEGGEVAVPASDDRTVEALGDGGAVVLRFEDPTLASRWQEIRDAGASWSFPGFKPHVTITWDAAGVDPDDVEPYTGPLVFGPEKFALVDDGWKDKLKETAVTKTSPSLKFLKFDNEQQMVYGWASVISKDGTDYEDEQGDVIDGDTLTKAVTEFMLDVRKAMAMHERNADNEIEDSMLKGIVVHSFPMTKEIMKSLGIDCDREGWIVGMKVTDKDVWKRVKSGELGAFSIGGGGNRVPI